jgi:hypothetical protein
MFQGMLHGGAGMRQFGIQLGQSTLEHLFVNFTGPIFQQLLGSAGALGSASGLGHLLKGTLFDPANAGGVQMSAAQMQVQAAQMQLRAAGGAMAGAGAAGGTMGKLGGLRGILRGFGINLPGLGAADVSGAIPAGADQAMLMSDINAMGAPGYIPGDLTTLPTLASDQPNLGLLQIPGTSTLSRDIGAGGMIAGGAMGIFAGLQNGGARGDIGAAAGAAGVASGVMSLIPSLMAAAPMAAPIVAGIGMALGMITSMFGDPREIRAKQISNEIRDALYMAPPSVSVGADITGAQNRVNRAGMTEANQYSAFQFKVNDPYYAASSGKYKWDVVPGSVVFNLNMPIQAFDAKSVMDQRFNLADAIMAAMQQAHPLIEQVQRAAGHR